VNTYPFQAEAPVTDAAREWLVHIQYGDVPASDTFDGDTLTVSLHFDHTEIDGGIVAIDRQTGDITVHNRGTGRRLILRRKYQRTPVTTAMIDNLVRLDRSAKDHMRIVEGANGGVRLFGFAFGLTVPQSDAIRDKAWVHVIDGTPSLTAVGVWVVDHADDLRDCLRRGVFLHAHDRQPYRDGIHCSRCRAILPAREVPARRTPAHVPLTERTRT